MVEYIKLAVSVEYLPYKAIIRHKKNKFSFKKYRNKIQSYLRQKRTNTFRKWLK